jgi:nitrilase
MSGHRVAVVQQPPVLLNRRATVERAAALIDEAAGEGARLITFPETYVPGYPEWVWRLRPGTDYEQSGEIHAQLMDNAVDLNSDALDPILAAARRRHVTVVVGLNEREGSFGRGTLYNTVVIVNADGEIANRHRKLMPTNPERMVWGLGDASGLRVVDTDSGRLGALICWENYMPLARYTLYAGGVQIYVAPTWDMGSGWMSTIVHIALEGRCWVIGNGTSLQGRDIPADFPGRDVLFPDPDEWINEGDSLVVAPNGTIVAGPLNKQHGILYAECDPHRSTHAHRTLDVTGHYSRPDVFKLEVRRDSAVPVSFTDGDLAVRPPATRSRNGESHSSGRAAKRQRSS